jgi:hypothetical protein
METLSNSAEEELLDWRPAWPEPILKAVVVGATTEVPSMERDRVTLPEPVPVTWNRTVYQTLLLML